MTNTEQVRIVVATVYGVIVTGEVSARDYNFPGNALPTKELKVISLKPAVITGVGLAWECNGRNGEHYLPLFHQLDPGHQFVFTIELFHLLNRHFRYSDIDPRRYRTTGLLVRAVTEWGHDSIPLPVTVEQQLDGQMHFYLPKLPATDPEAQ